MGFPGGSHSEESAYNAGDTGDSGDVGLIPRLGRSPGGRNSNSLQYSFLGSYGQRSLASYSPRDHKESDMTEGLSMHSSHITLS